LHVLGFGLSSSGHTYKFSKASAPPKI
jgi:hypothetical protein